MRLTKIFNIILFTFFFSLIVVQSLFLSGVGNKIYTSGKLSENDYGEITFELSGIKPDSEILVLENGEPIDSFYEKTVKVNVADNSVIEIDGTKVKDSFYVEIVRFSDNIKNKNTKKIKINQNIVIFDRYFLK